MADIIEAEAPHNTFDVCLLPSEKENTHPDIP